jgi:hypothetical protein
LLPAIVKDVGYQQSKTTYLAGVLEAKDMLMKD